MLLQSLGVVGLVFVFLLLATLMKHDDITRNSQKMGVGIASVWVMAFVMLSVMALIFYWSFYYAFISPFMN